VKLGGRHVFLELRLAHDPAEVRVGFEEHRVVKQDVVDPHDAFRAQDAVVDVVSSPMQRQPEAEVGVVIEIRARGDDPIDEPRADQRDDHRAPQAGGCQRSRQAHADERVGASIFST